MFDQQERRAAHPEDLHLSAHRGSLREAHLHHVAVIDVTPQGLFVIEMIAGMTLEKLQALTEPKLQLGSHWQALPPPEAYAA